MWWKAQPSVDQEKCSGQCRSTVDHTALFSVDVDHCTSTTALFYWSMLTKKSAAVDVDGTFHDQLYDKKFYILNTEIIIGRHWPDCVFLLVDVNHTALFLVYVNQNAIFYLVDGRRPFHCIFHHAQIFEIKLLITPVKNHFLETF